MMAVILAAAMVLFAALLYFVYDGYLRLLRVISRFASPADTAAVASNADLPTVAVLITVYNEAHQIVARVQNVLAQDYPGELIEVVVASDGSTDDLDAVIAEHFGTEARVVHAAGRAGKSSAQNQAVATIDADIVLFSDADTRFAPGFMRALVAPFADASVGAVQAHLLFVPADASVPLASQARYWRAELEIRRLEARLGILAVASGACIAVRRDLWHPLDPNIGEDCVIPLDVVVQSSKVAYAAAAIAYEPQDDEFDAVIRNRVRMTLRNWQGTWSRPTLLNPFTHPGYAFALWSHKLLRWLSPVFLLGLSITALALPLATSQRLLVLPAVVMVVFYVLAVVGRIGAMRARRLPVCTAIYSFVLANIGFLGGLLKAAFGDTISHYGERSSGDDALDIGRRGDRLPGQHRRVRSPADAPAATDCGHRDPLA